MSKFAPCLQCQRHVRVGEGACPFCGSATGTLAARSFQAPHGAKREILFALGTSLAAACSDPDDTGNQDTGSTPTSPATSASAANSSAASSATTAAPSDTNVQAIYGAPIPSGSVMTAASTSPAMSTGPAIQPPYGVPPLPTETIGVQPVYGAPVPSDWVDQDGGAPVDAGEADGAAADGGDSKDEDAGAAPTLNPSSAVALYGAIPAP